LNPGETWAYTGDYRLTQDDINNNENIDNTATVSSNEAPEKSSSVGMPIDQKADLSIYKSIIGIDEAGDYMINNPGDVIQYQVAVQNNGKVDLTGVSVRDPMITLAGPFGDDVGHGILNPGETWTYTGEYTVTQADIDSNGNGDGFIENTATARCNELPSKSSSIELPIISIPFIGTDTGSSTDKVLPVANFSTNVKSGYAPLSVQFSDLSQKAASRTWDFNNDGIVDSSDQNPVYVYTTPGTYIAKLTVRNENGTDSMTAPITVMKLISSGSSGSSHRSSDSSYSDSSSSSVSGSTAKATVTETEIKPVTNTGIKAANEPTPVQTQSPKTSKKGSTGMPGFEIVSGIIGLLAVFLYRRK
jgi:PKD repeat protein